EQGRPAHAYLIAGPAGVGKTRLAFDLARAVNCTGAEPPCGACRACHLIEEGRHPDVETVTVGGLCDEADHDHRRDGSKEIKICQVRRVQRVLSLQPYEGLRRVVIVEPADAMNVYGADAFLKTLEEPPDRVLLILVTANDAVLSETIISRCRRIILGPVPLATVRAELERRGVDLERAELLARLSGGRMGEALVASENETVLSEREQRLRRLEALAKAGRAERMAFAAELAGRFARERQDVYAYLDLWQKWWRDVLLVQENCPDLVENYDRLPQLSSVAAAVAPVEVVRSLHALHECRRHLEENANARLALEVLVLHFPRPVISEEVGTR
ncbi:MAG: ATP-binding protein, partial [Dehalococcoidia bacterium]